VFGCSREKLEAWLAKRGKTPSRYRHMMCFGHNGHSDGHVDGKSTKLSVGQHVAKRESGNGSNSVTGDQVACSLFTVTESHCIYIFLTAGE